MSSRSLNVPGSISSALHMRYLCPGEQSSFFGTKLHLIPVGNPAPPRPRSFEFFTSERQSAGAINLSAFRNPKYPSLASYLSIGVVSLTLDIFLVRTFSVTFHLLFYNQQLCVLT